jgi:uncharacterized protein (DUF433 family)
MDDELIDRYIDWTPHARADARLRKYGVHVWAVIGQLRVANGDGAAVACVYDIPLEAVEAARAYYRRNKKYIDAHLLLNSA